MDLVNPTGICCTSTIGASIFFSRYGITLCSDFGPPVEHASATSLLLPVGAFFVTVFALAAACVRVAATAAWAPAAADTAVFIAPGTAAVFGFAWFSTESRIAVRSARNFIPLASMMFSGFVIKSIAPYSMACIVILASSFVRELTTITVARIFSFCNFCRSSRPFIRGMLMSKSTAS